MNDVSLAAELPLADIIDPQLLRLPDLPPQHRQGLPQLQPQGAGAAPASGLLDFAAFGLTEAPAQPEAPKQPPQQQPSSSIDTGMLDMAAFGMAPLPEPVQQQQQPTSIDTGMLDMAAFGMAPLPEPEQQQQQPSSIKDRVS